MGIATLLSSPSTWPSLPPRTRLALASLGIGLLGWFFAWFGSQMTGFPSPVVHDEHAYLLAGETFASGRLAMPAHPMGMFFETYHQLQSPTYASKYPPGQGLFLALGFLLGTPIFGVWLSHALLSAAMVWTARAFMPLRWAAVTGLICSLWFGLLCYWTQSYWGGTVAALGGVLVWGGAKRWHDTPAVVAALWVGLGAALMMLTRPFEGLLACVLPGFLMTRRLLLLVRGAKRDLRAAATVTVVLLPVLAAGAFQLQLNKAVTGHFLTLPYTEYNRQFDANPLLAWQSPGTPRDYNHERLEYFDRTVAQPMTRFPTPLLPFIRDRFHEFLRFYGGPLLVLGLICAVLAPSRWARWWLIATGASLSSLVLSYYFLPHYLAPLLAPALLLGVWSLRRLQTLTHGRVTLRGPHHALLVIAFLGWMFSRGEGIELNTVIREHAAHREAVIQRLEREPGRHLVLVDYEPGLNAHVEYVFNRADIDAQQIVWARWHPAAGKAGLFDHYKDRKLWLLRVVRGGDAVLREFNWVPGSNPAGDGS